MLRRVLWSVLGAVILFARGFVSHVVLRPYDPACQVFGGAAAACWRGVARFALAGFTRRVPA